jgi:hypothetical protein
MPEKKNHQTAHLIAAFEGLLIVLAGVDGQNH